MELNFQNNGLLEGKSSKNNGLGAIRTPDLRHVKMGNLAFILAFSDLFALFSATFAADETTTRNESAQSRPCAFDA
jgi:hypothetical protein